MAATEAINTVKKPNYLLHFCPLLGKIGTKVDHILTINNFLTI